MVGEVGSYVVPSSSVWMDMPQVLSGNKKKKREDVEVPGLEYTDRVPWCMVDR